jgi:hypothetical protein
MSKTMSLDYIRRTNQLFHSTVLNKSIFIDELPDLSDTDLDRLIIEAEISGKFLKEDYDALSHNDESRVPMKHKIKMRRAYYQQALIEKQLRGVDRQERFYDLVAKQLGNAEVKALLEQAKG